MSPLLQTGKIVKMTNFLVWFTIFGMLTQYGGCDKFLIMHPFYSGSHVLTLHHVAESLVNRGHQVIKLDILETGHENLSIRVTKLSCCQNDLPRSTFGCQINEST